MVIDFLKKLLISEPSKTNLGVINKGPGPTDYIAGQESAVKYEEINNSMDWRMLFPKGEYQNSVYFDSRACVTFSADNSLETQAPALRTIGKLSQNQITKLKNWGYIDENNQFNFSDRFGAKGSGTTLEGNYLQKVADFLRNVGTVPEKMWAYPRLQREPVFTWADYYRDIPDSVQEFAKNFLEIFEVKYEWVQPSISEMKKHLKQAPLQIAAPVCPGWFTDNPVKTCPQTAPEHATLLLYIDENDNGYFIGDSYEPFIKKLDSNYPIPYAFKIVLLVRPEVEEVKPEPVQFTHNFRETIYYMGRGPEVAALQKALCILGFFPKSIPEENYGYYGNITKQAVIDFQKLYKLASLSEILYVRGRWVGPKTRAKSNEFFNKI
jgi:hypothetical protein